MVLYHCLGVLFYRVCERTCRVVGAAERSLSVINPAALTLASAPVGLTTSISGEQTQVLAWVSMTASIVNGLFTV